MRGYGCEPGLKLQLKLLWALCFRKVSNEEETVREALIFWREEL